jgi:hypothetical protein
MSMKFLDFFDSPPHAGNNVDEHLCKPRHTVAKRRASSRCPPPTILMLAHFLHPGCNPLSVFVGVTPHGKLQLVNQSSNHKHFTVIFLQI